MNFADAMIKTQGTARQIKLISAEVRAQTLPDSQTWVALMRTEA